MNAKQNFPAQSETFFLLPKVKSEPRLPCQDSAHRTKCYCGCYLSALLLTDIVFSFSFVEQVYLYLNCQWKLTISRLVLDSNTNKNISKLQRISCPEARSIFVKKRRG